MHDRILAAVGNRTYRHVGELTGTHPETVRRYLQGQSPSAEFIAALSTALNINADWILTGRGPMKCEELKAHALATADGSELLQAMSEVLDRLIDRVERVEVYMQTLETRVRAGQETGQPIDLREPKQASPPGISPPRAVSSPPRPESSGRGRARVASDESLRGAPPRREDRDGDDSGAGGSNEEDPGRPRR